LNKEALKSSENKSDPTTVVVVDTWNHTDFMCKNYILNELDNIVYDVYSQIKSEKALWETLDKNYKVEDADVKKFIVIKFLDFKMVDSRIVMSQVQEFQLILHDIYVEGESLSELFQVATIIEKLSPS